MPKFTKKYLKAGADIIETNTFLQLHCNGRLPYGRLVYELNYESAKIQEKFVMNLPL